MSKPAPIFRQIAAPLDVPDDALNALGDKLGVPTMVRPEQPPAPVSAPGHEIPASQPPGASKFGTPAPHQPSPRPLVSTRGLRPEPPRRITEKITVELPDYLAAAVRREGLERRTTARTLVIMGLKALGFEVDEQDLIPDGRRARPQTQPIRPENQLYGFMENRTYRTTVLDYGQRSRPNRLRR